MSEQTLSEMIADEQYFKENQHTLKVPDELWQFYGGINNLNPSESLRDILFHYACEVQNCKPYGCERPTPWRRNRPRLKEWLAKELVKRQQDAKRQQEFLAKWQAKESVCTGEEST